MARPWEVSADDIVAWANSAAAPATFPKLIRRLLFATTPLRSLVAYLAVTQAVKSWLLRRHWI
jgi:hypothetical protein